MSNTYIVSTDLDGTLLDHHDYSFTAANQGLQRCAELGVPVVINTSKTYAEVISLQHAIGLDAPLIVENGSALIAAKHLCLDAAASGLNSLKIECQSRDDGAHQFVFGVKRDYIISFIERIRQQHSWSFEGFNDWSFADIAQHTGLDLASAQQASQKEFSEPFVWHDSESALKQFIELAKADGLSVLQGGRFYHLQGNTDKAQPLNWLRQYGHTFFKGMPNGNSPPKLICLGDSNNDVAMLNVADHPICVRSPVADFPILSGKTEAYYTQGYGPVGWSEAVLSLLES